MSYITKKDIDNSTVITIIGSTKFYDDMKMAALSFNDMGSTSLCTFVDKSAPEGFEFEEKSLMIEGYKRLSLSDIALVINKDGYIGDNTLREIQYASFIAKIPVLFDSNYITEKALKELNIYYIGIDGSPCLFNETELNSEKYPNIGCLDLEADKFMRTIMVRKRPIINDETMSILGGKVATGYDTERLITIYKSALVNAKNIPVLYLEDDEFENTIRKSQIYKG